MYGISLQSEQTKDSLEVAKLLMDKIDKNFGTDHTKLSFDQKLDVMWASCALGLENNSKSV